MFALHLARGTRPDMFKEKVRKLFCLKCNSVMLHARYYSFYVKRFLFFVGKSFVMMTVDELTNGRKKFETGLK